MKTKNVLKVLKYITNKPWNFFTNVGFPNWGKGSCFFVEASLTCDIVGFDILSPAPLGGWTPMVVNMILSGQYQMSPTHKGRVDPYWGTFDIFWEMSFVPDTQGEGGPLLGDIWYCPGNIICPDTLGRLDPYCGTFDIVWTLSNVPGTFRRLDPYGGTYDIVRALSNVPGTFRRLGPYGGHMILSGHYQMSRPIWDNW